MERHSGKNQKEKDMLTFREFSEANNRRHAECFGHSADWEPTDWGCAVAGEVGELCNLLKKMKRGDRVCKEDVADEIGDVVAYLDRLSTVIGIDLEEATKVKFNKTSVRVGSQEQIS